jgi:Tol biopolymer transport system component
MKKGLHGKHLLGGWALGTSALVVSVAIAAIGASQARAAFPGTNGKIVFETNRDGNEEIYTMNADGTNRVDLTRNSADDTDPRWSADGTGSSLPATGLVTTRSTR